MFPRAEGLARPGPSAGPPRGCQADSAQRCCFAAFLPKKNEKVLIFIFLKNIQMNPSSQALGEVNNTGDPVDRSFVAGGSLEVKYLLSRL